MIKRIISLIILALLISCDESKTSDTAIAAPNERVEIESRGVKYNLTSKVDLDKMMTVEKPYWQLEILQGLDDKTPEEIKAIMYAINYFVEKGYDFSIMTWYLCWTKEEQREYMLNYRMHVMKEALWWHEGDLTDKARLSRMKKAWDPMVAYKNRVNKKHRDCRKEERRARGL